MKLIDGFLNRITMYRLVLYALIALIALSAFFGYLNLIPYSPFSIIISTLLLIIFSVAADYIFSSVFGAPTNVESVYITALILALIVSPARGATDIVFLGWVALWGVASKYIFAVNKKHIFNPAAMAVLLTVLVINQSASWWVGTPLMMPFVVMLGLLVVRKIRREDLVFSFVLSALLTIFVFTVLKGADVFSVLNKVMFHSSLFFFAFIMLTEPLTTPPKKNGQILYGILVGVLFAPDIHVGSIYSTPELALLVGNIFSYLLSSKQKLILNIKEKLHLAPDVIDFIFLPKKRLAFTPGQYMEWTLPHKNPDNRGNRRFFTIASSPTEREIRLGVKFYPNGSSYKKKMANLDDNTPIIGASLAGDFTMPRNPRQKLVFIAGGIGVTPFRSMIKFMIDKNEKRDVIIFYSNRNKNEIIYADVFEEAREKLGIKTIYTLTDRDATPFDWRGETGRISKEMIEETVPDYPTRTFYLSGTHAMTTGMEKNVKRNGNSQKSD